MSFYVTLPSNSSMDIFKNNSMSNYTTKLSVPLRFDVSYEVALVEIAYRHSWFIPLGKLEIDTKSSVPLQKFDLEIVDGELLEKFTQRLNNIVEERFLRLFYNERYQRGQDIANGKIRPTIDQGTLPLSTYDDPNPNNRQMNVVKEIREDRKFIAIPKFTYENNRFKVANYGKYHYRFSGDICKFLKITSNWMHGLSKRYYSGDLLSYDTMLTQVIYVYTDIIQDQFIGDSFSKLLGVVVVDKEYSKTASTIYKSPHYVKLNRTEINTIQIELKNDNGEPIRFREGKVFVKLHFRPIV